MHKCETSEIDKSTNLNIFVSPLKVMQFGVYIFMSVLVNLGVVDWIAFVVENHTRTGNGKDCATNFNDTGSFEVQADNA